MAKRLFATLLYAIAFAMIANAAGWQTAVGIFIILFLNELND